MYNSSQLKPFLAHKSEDGTRFQTVKEHLEGTAGLAAQFAADFGGEEQARLAGLLHDIGKYSAGFQRRLEGGPKVDHSTAFSWDSSMFRSRWQGTTAACRTAARRPTPRGAAHCSAV